MKILKSFLFVLLIVITYILSNVMIGLASFIVFIFYKTSVDNISIYNIIDNPYIIRYAEDKVTEYSLLLTFIASLVSLILFFIIHILFKEKLIKKIKFSKISLKNILFCIFFGIFLNYSISIVIYYIEKLFSISKVIDNYEEMVNKLMENNNLIVSILIIGILGPIFEEILLRGIIQNELKKSLNIYLAIIIQAIIFSVIHGNIVQSSYAFILGIIIGFSYFISKSIWTPIIIHSTINLQSTILSSSNIYELYSKTVQAIPFGENTIIIISLIISIIFSIFLFKGKEFSLKNI